MIVDHPFREIICPIITPFDNKEGINFEVFTEHTEQLINKNVTSIMVGGTTGEGMLLSKDERKVLLEKAKNVSKGRIKVIARVGSMTTDEAVHLAKHAVELSVDGISAITPYFFNYSEEEVYCYYRAIAESADNIPVSLYTFPGNAKHDISANLFSKLSNDFQNIVAIKSSNPDLIRFSEYVYSVKDPVSVMCGVDALTLPALSIGGHGQISGNSNIFPEVFQNLFASYYEGDLDRARHYQRQINDIRSVLKDSIAHFKAAIELLGLPVGSPRSPMLVLSNNEREKLNDDLIKLRETLAL